MRKAVLKGAIKYTKFRSLHLAGVVEICRGEGWPSFSSDPETALRAFTARGVITVVACQDSKVVGFAYLKSDGTIQAHLSLIAVRPECRRRRVARRLLETGFASRGAKRIDLVSTGGAEDFYRSFRHRDLPGFRIYPRSRRELPAATVASDLASGTQAANKAAGAEKSAAAPFAKRGSPAGKEVPTDRS